MCMCMCVFAGGYPAPAPGGYAAPPPGQYPPPGDDDN